MTIYSFQQRKTVKRKKSVSFCNEQLKPFTNETKYDGVMFAIDVRIYIAEKTRRHEMKTEDSESREITNKQENKNGNGIL